MNETFSAISEENILRYDAVVFDSQVVAERDFQAVEYLYVLAAMFEDVTGEHGAHPKAQPVIQSHGRAVVHHPKPDERLALGVFHCIDVPVVFWLECRVARIEGMHQGLPGQSSGGIRGCISVPEVMFVKGLADAIA